MKTSRWLTLATSVALAALAIWPDVRTGHAQSKDRGRAKAAPRAAAFKGRVGDLDTDRSRVYVHVGKTGLGHEHGVAGRIKTGVIWLGATNEAGLIVFDMKSFTADELEAREYVGLQGEVVESTREKVTANMRGPDVLSTAKFPTARFELESAIPILKKKPNSPTEYRLTGDFELHGVSRKLSVVVQAEAIDDMIRLHGKFPILQSHFGIKPYSMALGTIGVADQLIIWADIWIRAEDARANEKQTIQQVDGEQPAKAPK